MEENTHTIMFRGISIYVTGIFEKPEEETNSKGGFGATGIKITDSEGNESDEWFYILSNENIEEINRIVFEENYS